jgi:hypothetical protein
MYSVNPQWQDPRQACLLGVVSVILCSGVRFWVASVVEQYSGSVESIVQKMGRYYVHVKYGSLNFM